MKRTASFAIALLAGTGLPTLATDLGTLGPTYEIAEPHLLRMIEERLRDKERSGELARIEQEARARGTDIVRNPVPVASVRTTATPRTFYFNPTYTLDRNLRWTSCPSRATCCSSTHATAAKSAAHAS